MCSAETLCRRNRPLVAAWFLWFSSAATTSAAEYVVGLGAEVDTQDARAFAVLADFAVGDETWAGFSVAHSHIDDTPALRDTRAVDVDLDHSFERVGVRVGAGYWGDPDLLDSVDLRAAFYLHNPGGTLSADFERREFDLRLGGDAIPLSRTVEFSANGLGVSARQEFAERFEIFGGGMWYEYSRNVRLQRDFDSLRFLSRSRLALMNSLIDSRWHVGIETGFGLRRVDLRVGAWRNAVDGGRVDSIGVGFLSPLGKRTDIELRLAQVDSVTFGRSTVLSVFLYVFGGS